MRQTDDDVLDSLVRAADPLGETTFGGTAALLGRMAAEKAYEQGRELAARRRLRRKRRLSIAMITAALVGVGVAGTAFGYMATARTGIFGPVTTESDGSEWLRTDAADYRQVLEQIVPTHIALPAGWSWDEGTDRFVAQGRLEPALTQVTGMKGTYAFFAHCAWVTEWLTANRSGDGVRAMSAVEQLRRAPEWPEFVAIDGGGVRDSLRAQAEAAARGDAAVMLEWNRTCLSGFGAAHQ